MSEGFLVDKAVAACLPIAGRVVEEVFQVLKVPGSACRSVRRELSRPLTGSRMRMGLTDRLPPSDRERQTAQSLEGLAEPVSPGPALG